MKLVYPLIMKLTKRSANTLVNEAPSENNSIHPLNAVANNGTEFSFKKFEGKFLLISNTASNCGYTGQYAELQTLYTQYKSNLEILAFPANDFKEQEKGNDKEIAEFCQLNYGVTFPIMKKSVVIKTDVQNEVFKWLSTKEANGWNSQAPSWNFSKYLLDPNGKLIAYFDPAVSPLDDRITKHLS